ncbi:hypothetical protein D9758_010353 [Tetrapyrgos nigripes]|uniref:Peptidase metallopeptidase domain-containing protein n=1 Tax=Tetrapyrgos nigripes TaxID=182062 RepID=A0A8H5D152_9AGAR|nr:hypothetical protein D9758_010353 [Tetrapyrgos nigripes]
MNPFSTSIYAHHIMSTPTVVCQCGPIPKDAELPFWPNDSGLITISFFGGTDAQKNIIKKAFEEYATYANITFNYKEDNASDADLRIAFTTGKALSAIGKNAAKVPKEQPTMDLGAITGNTDDVSVKSDRAVVLHQIGHALGLRHEFDDTKAIVESNFHKVDVKSVMSTTQTGAIVGNSELSNFDKALLLVVYPGKTPAYGEDLTWNVDLALQVLRFPEDVKREISNSKDIAKTRTIYATYVSKELAKIYPVGPTPPPGPKTDELDPILALALIHPSFRETVTRMVESDLRSRGQKLRPRPVEQSSADSAVPAEFVQALIAQLAMGGGASIGVQQGINGGAVSRPLPPDIQQGIFGAVLSMLKNPIFHNVVGSVVKAVI